MCDQTEISYSDEEVVWVKLGSCWWPGEVVAPDKLSPDVLRSFRKPPIAIVKFFQEDAYEFVKNINSIYKYQCSRKHEFINKGLSLYRNKHGLMEKFPEDVIRAETKVGGDIEILTRDEFQETKKESYAGLFGTPAKKAVSIKKGRGYPSTESPKISTPGRWMKEKTDYKVHILVQGAKPTPAPESPITSTITSTPTSTAEETGTEGPTSTEYKPDSNTENVDKPIVSTVSTPTPFTPTPSTPSSSVGMYACHACPFTTTRLNVLILHNKSHSVSYVPYTPTPVKKKQPIKSPAKTTPKTSKTPKQRKPRKEKSDQSKSIKNINTKKRTSEEKILEVENKKTKTDEEIKSSLLADWDDGDDDSNDESTTNRAQSPEVPLGAESPAVPTPAELPSAQILIEATSLPEKKVKSSPSAEKAESSSDSKYEFCEDEDWPVEADAGRKIPRVKNPVRTDETKSISIDDDDMAREVAELLNKTAVPELPSVPEPLKVEENFLEPSVVKSPDKNLDNLIVKSTEGVTDTPPTKAIFKTKTFFRSRHSRSQDAIGKYVAEQLNIVEKMDIAESEINGSDGVSSPEARDSPPIEQVKVARLAPKIQLKRMKAEAQLREKSKNRFEPSADPYSLLADIMVSEEKPESPQEVKEKDNLNTLSFSMSPHSVLYPTQEIKPPPEESNNEPVSIYDSFTESEEKSESTIDKNHQVNTESESNQDNKAEHLNETDHTGPELNSNVGGEINLEDTSKVDEELGFEKTVNDDNIEKSEVTEMRRVTTEILLPKTTETYLDEPKTLEPPPEPYMSESTASAVDALLSVSREADRVTRTISDDPPEDLFEDDKDVPDININGNTNDTMDNEKEISQIIEITEITTENIRKTEMAEEMKNEPEIKLSLGKTQESEVIKEKESDPGLFSQRVNLPVVQEKDPQHSSFSIKEQELTTVQQESEIKNIFAEKEEPVKEVNDESKNEFSESEDICADPVENVEVSEIIENSDNCTVLGNGNETSATHEEVENNLYPRNELQISLSHKEADKHFNHCSVSENEEEITTTQVDSDKVMEESVFLQNEEEIPAMQDEAEVSIENNPDVYMENTDIFQNEEVVTTPHDSELHEIQNKNSELTVENVPSESDLQIAEALINLPATALQGQTPTNHIENQMITSSFDMDNVQEKVIPALDNIAIKETVPIEKAPESTNKLDQPFTSNDDSVNARFETEQEKSENLNAAQSLLHMAESIEHTINMPDPMDTEAAPKVVLNTKQNNGVDDSIEQNIAKLSNETMAQEPEKVNSKPFHTSSSKLLQILEEPSKPKFVSTKIQPAKQIIMHKKEKILNFDVAKSSFKGKTNSPQQKIIIRRATPVKNVMNNLNEVASQEKIILSRSGNPSQDGSSIQTFTIQTKQDTPSDANTIIIQQKIRKLSKPAAKLQNLKPRPSFIPTASETNTISEETSVDNAMFDINSMPIVLSDDLITPESIEKMPVVMSDANIAPQPIQPTKGMKPKQSIKEIEKITVTSMPRKQDVKTLLLNPVSEVSKSTAPNILSKSSKLRAAKPMLVIDKVTGKQKIIMTKADPTIKEMKQIQPAPTVKQIQPVSTVKHTVPVLKQSTQVLKQTAPVLKQTATVFKQIAPTLKQTTQTLIQSAPTLIQTSQTLIQSTQTLIQSTPTSIQTAPLTKKPSQAEKFIILPTQNTQRTGRTQKIVIDPQTGKAHVILSKGNEPAISATENKPVSAKLIPSKSDANMPGNTVMIITNAQGAQSRIVLTPEHEKILFPNKQQQKGSQLKTIAHRVTTASALPQLKTVLTPPPVKQVVAAAKTPTRIVPKQKNAIITSKGQLIVGGRVATTAQNIAPMPEIRTVPKRLAQTEPRKLVQAIQKRNSEPIIFLQQKPGAVMQLTASQFDQLQRTGQIVHKAAPQPAPENKVVIQKARSTEPSSSRARVRKSATGSPTPAKKIKHEVAIAPAPAPARPAPAPAPPALAPIQSAPAPPAPSIPAPAPALTFTATPTLTPDNGVYPEFDNFEEMLPSTAIARQPEPPPPPSPEPLPASALTDSQLLAVPGEHFGGPVGSFYLCVVERGNYVPIDNRPLVLENDQLVPLAEATIAPAPAPERRDILEAALANSDVFRGDGLARDEAPDFRDLNATVSVHCRVSETSTTLNQPIMTPLEMPSKADVEPAVASSLEAGLAVIGVTPPAVPTSLELPITVTDPRIAPRTADPLGGGGYGTTLMPSPGAELCYVSSEERVSAAPISMPLLTEEEEAGGGEGGMSMPILTEEAGSESPQSAPRSPAAGAGAWPPARRLLTPSSDASDLSLEIPLQPSLRLSVGDLSDHT